MVKNNKLLETLSRCVNDNNKYNGDCRGCFYGESSVSRPQCMLNLMNDVLFFFGNPYPDPDAHILSLEELEEALSDRKDHLAFCEYISSIHVAMPAICTVKSSGNFITFSNSQTDLNETFNKSTYYTSFRVWSTKPTDSLRINTPWENSIDSDTDNSPINKSKAQSILSYISKMNQ